MKKKYYKIFLNLISVLIIFFTIFSIAVNKNFGDGFLGRKFFIVLSDSMKPKFQAGDIVVTKTIDPETLEVGDIITFYVKNGSVVTHKIHEIKLVDSKDVFITKGINVDIVDEEEVTLGRVIGKYSFSLPLIGNVIMFTKKTEGFILLVLLPLLLIFVSYLLDFIKALKINKKKRIEELQSKNQELESMKDELNILKNQLNNGNNGEV